MNFLADRITPCSTIGYHSNRWASCVSIADYTV